MSSLDGKLRHVEHEESDLKRKANELEKKEEQLEHQHHFMDGTPFEPAMNQVRIHMVPLMPHFESNPDERFFGAMHRIGDIIKNRI